MEEHFIQLNKSNTLKLKIKDSEGNETGEYLEFDLEDIELPLKYQEMLEEEKKNKNNLRNELIIIDKRQDVKGKKLMSKNEEDKIKAINKFFNREVEIYNMFLGDNGVQKLLNGKKIGWTALDDVNEIVVNQISPYLNMSMESITKKIKERYNLKNNEVLKNE